MSLVSIRLAEPLLNELKARAAVLHMSQTEYIRTAILKMNKHVLKNERKQKLERVSLRVRGESMTVNDEFSRIEYDPKD